MKRRMNVDQQCAETFGAPSGRGIREMSQLGSWEGPAGTEPPDVAWEIQVPAAEREVALGTVSAGDTWSFSAAGEWRTGFVRCGPDGYRNFFHDALDFNPRAPSAARLKLMGKFRGDPDSDAFPI